MTETECKTKDLGNASFRKHSSSNNLPAIGDCISVAFILEGNIHGAIWHNEHT